MNPWWFVLNALPVIGWIVLTIVMIKAGPTRLVTIVTTERALSNKGRLNPAAVLFRGPREPLGDPSGIWGSISVHGERYWVRRRFHGSVRLANDFLPDPGTPPASSPD